MSPDYRRPHVGRFWKNAGWCGASGALFGGLPLLASGVPASEWRRPRTSVGEHGDGEEHRVVEEVGEHGAGQPVVLLERAAGEVPERDHEQEAEPVVDVVAGAQNDAEK